MKIYKLQIPLGSTDPDPKILAYPEDDRADMHYLPMIKKNLRWFPRGSKMTYVYAKVDAFGRLQIKKSAPWQDW